MHTYRIQDENIITGSELILTMAANSLSFETTEKVFELQEIEINLQSLKTLSFSLPFVEEALKIQSEYPRFRNLVYTFFNGNQSTSSLPRPLVNLVLGYADVPVL